MGAAGIAVSQSLDYLIVQPVKVFFENPPLAVPVHL